MITVTPNSSVRELAQALLKNRISAVPVDSQGQLVGIVSEGPAASHEIAILMEQNSIKRVPIVSKGQLVGIVSRANLIQAVASKNVGLEVKQEDAAIRDKLLAHLKAQRRAHTALLNVNVYDELVHLWGVTSSEIERKAICVAAHPRESYEPQEPANVTSASRLHRFAIGVHQHR